MGTLLREKLQFFLKIFPHWKIYPFFTLFCFEKCYQVSFSNKLQNQRTADADPRGPKLKIRGHSAPRSAARMSIFRLLNKSQNKIQKKSLKDHNFYIKYLCLGIFNNLDPRQIRVRGAEFSCPRGLRGPRGQQWCPRSPLCPPTHFSTAGENFTTFSKISVPIRFIFKIKGIFLSVFTFGF